MHQSSWLTAPKEFFGFFFGVRVGAEFPPSRGSSVGCLQPQVAFLALVQLQGSLGSQERALPAAAIAVTAPRLSLKRGFRAGCCWAPAGRIPGELCGNLCGTAAEPGLFSSFTAAALQRGRAGGGS